jgi:hypothetical protein
MEIFMPIPPTWQTPIVVLGLLLGLLVSAALVRRYQEYKAYQRARLRALVAASASLERTLEQLARVPLSQPLRSALRDYLARQYAAIGKLHKAYPDIAKLIDTSRLRVAQDGGALNGHVPAIGDHAEYVRMLGAMDQVIDLLAHRGAALRAAARVSEWTREARERRAEISARFFIVQAHRAHARGDNRETLMQLRILLEQLQQRGPDTAFVRGLYQEAEAMYVRVVRGQPLLDETAAEAPDHRSNRSSAA